MAARSVTWIGPLAKDLRNVPGIELSVELGVRSVLSALDCAAVPSCRLVVWAYLSEVSEKGRGSVRTWLRRWLTRRPSPIHDYLGRENDYAHRRPPRVSQPPRHNR